MNWAADGIAIAGRREAMDQQQLQREGVEAVLQLYAGGVLPTEHEPRGAAGAESVKEADPRARVSRG